MSVSWVARLKLDPDLPQPGVDLLLGAGTVDEHGRELGHDDPARGPEMLGLDVGQRQPLLLGDHLAAGEHREVVQVRDPAMPEPARTTIALSVPCWLFWTRIPSAAPSAFSAKISSGRGSFMIASSVGMMSWTLVIG